MKYGESITVENAEYSINKDTCGIGDSFRIRCSVIINKRIVVTYGKTPAEAFNEAITSKLERDLASQRREE